MKRDDRLRLLSDDHHQALVLARRATAAGDGAGAGACQQVWAEVLHRFDAELAPHFAIEETLLLPALQRQGAVELVARTHADHAGLRAIVRDADGPIEARLRAFGELLRDHVKFEERELFATIQATIGDDVLDAVAAACQSARPPEPARDPTRDPAR